MPDRQGELDRLVEDALRDRKSNLVEGGREIEFLCPAHGDTNRPSAQWNKSRHTWHCKTCGASGSTAKLAELLGVSTEIKKTDGRIVKTYDYTDPEGNLLYQVVRRVPKNFQLRQPDQSQPGGWNWRRPRKVSLYRLQWVARCPEDEWVVLFEGEKDADTAAALGITYATTAPFGAQEPTKDGRPGKPKWAGELNDLLRGKNVLLCYDEDPAGQNTQRQLVSLLRPHTRRAVAMRLPDLPEERAGGKLKDMTDWVSIQGHTLEDFWEAANQVIVESERALLDALPDQPKVESEDIILSFGTTDAGNAELFAHLYGQECRYDHQRGRWLLWKGDRWGEDVDGQRYRWGIDAARTRGRAAVLLAEKQSLHWLQFSKRSENTGSLESCLKLTQSMPPIADSGRGWDANPFLLGVSNGVVNLATGEHRRGRQEDRITLGTNIPYLPNAPAHRFVEFLHEVFRDHPSGPEAMVAYLHRAIGYSITGSTREQVYFMCHGSGANGKSTLLEVLARTLGDYAGNLPFTALQKGREQAIPTDLADLPGQRFVTASETTEHSTINEARIKALTGGDLVTARQLYQRQFKFNAELKLWMAMNHLPNVTDDTEGFWRRVRLIEFGRQFTPEERDLDLKEKLFGEIEGILAWAVQGAIKWHEVGLLDPPEVLGNTTEYRDSVNPVTEFIRDCCVEEEGHSIRAGVLYASFRDWSEKQGLRQISNRTFGMKMTEKFTRMEGMEGRSYINLRFRSERSSETGPYDGF